MSMFSKDEQIAIYAYFCLCMIAIYLCYSVIAAFHEQEKACIKRGGTYAREICFSKGVINE